METTLTLTELKPRHRIRDLVVRRLSHPWMAMAIYLPLAALLWFLTQAAEPRPWFTALLWVVGGVFTWTLVEYGLHRFIFHWTEVKEPWRTLASGLHMAHHRTADSEDLILAPPVVSLTFGALVFLSLSLMTWSWTRGALMMIGIFLGYLAYEWVHFGAHRFKARTPVGKFLKHYHLQHHFKNPRRFYGVTSPLWDWVFGTLAVKK